MSLRFVLLGLLSENAGHGYGLRKDLAHRLGHFRKINEGQLYTELARMEKEELIEREAYIPEKGPVRKVLHITTKGRSLFQNWLVSEALEDTGVLYDFIQGFSFLSKCTFFRHLEPHQARAKINTQLAIVDKKKKAYKKILKAMKQRNVDRFRIRILEFGIQEMDHRLRWLRSLEREVRMLTKEREVNE